jgi:hypothetical protein
MDRPERESRGNLLLRCESRVLGWDAQRLMRPGQSNGFESVNLNLLWERLWRSAVADEKVNGTLRRELVVAIVSILTTALIAAIGWGIVDRIQWQADKQQIAINTGRLDIIERRLAQSPFDPQMAEEVANLRQDVKDLSARIDELLLALNRRRSNIDPPSSFASRPGDAGDKKKAGHNNTP